MSKAEHVPFGMDAVDPAPGDEAVDSLGWLTCFPATYSRTCSLTIRVYNATDIHQQAQHATKPHHIPASLTNSIASRSSLGQRGPSSGSQARLA